MDNNNSENHETKNSESSVWRKEIEGIRYKSTQPCLRYNGYQVELCCNHSGVVFARFRSASEKTSANHFSALVTKSPKAQQSSLHESELPLRQICPTRLRRTLLLRLVARARQNADADMFGADDIFLAISPTYGSQLPKMRQLEFNAFRSLTCHK